MIIDGPFYFTDSTSGERFKFTEEVNMILPVKVTDDFKFVMPNNHFFRIEVTLKSGKWKTVQIEPATMESSKDSNRQLIQDLSHERRKERLGSYVLCTSCGSPLNDIKEENISHSDDESVYTYVCQDCGKLSSFNFDVAPVPIAWDIETNNPVISNNSVTLAELIGMNNDACIIGMNSFDGSFIDERDWSEILSNSSRNEVLQDSSSIRLYTDDNKYDLYILDRQPTIITCKEIVKNTLLKTRDGLKIGNAIVSNIKDNGIYCVTTDLGNKMQISLSELNSLFIVSSIASETHKYFTKD